MKIEMYAIYDSAAKQFRAPMFMKTVGLAERAFSEAVNSQDTELARHPGDFSLWRVGTFEDDTGVVVPEQAPVRIIDANQCVRQQPSVADTNVDQIYNAGGTA